MRSAECSLIRRVYTAAIIGGSISCGAGEAGDWHLSWTWLNDHFPVASVPGARHELVNSAAPAVMNKHFCSCLQHFVPLDADLVLVCVKVVLHRVRV